jgi:hypothetical protein
MGMRCNSVSLKKIAALFIVIGLSLGVANQVSGFSAADLKSDVGIMITNSESSLIGTPGSVNAGTIIQGNSKNIDIIISNNMSNVIEVMDITGGEQGVSAKLLSTIRIFPGDKVEVPVMIKADSDAEAGERLFNLVYRSKWGGGTAVIEGNLSVDIQEPVQIQSTVQNITINKDNFVEVDNVNKHENKYEIVNIEFPEDKYITTDLSQVTVQDDKITLPIKVTSMEPNLYEVPTIFTIDSDGCVSKIETAIYLNIELEEKEAEKFTYGSTYKLNSEANNEILSNQETGNTNNSENTEGVEDKE